MATSNFKQRVLEAIQQLPSDATFEDVIERLYFLAKVERGIAQVDAGQTIAHDAARERLMK